MYKFAQDYKHVQGGNKDKVDVPNVFLLAVISYIALVPITEEESNHLFDDQCD